MTTPSGGGPGGASSAGPSMPRGAAASAAAGVGAGAGAAGASASGPSSSSSSSGLSFKLHPLVIVNISEHYTRVMAQQRGVPSRIVGCVLGCQAGRTVEIFNSFELLFHDSVSALEPRPSSADAPSFPASAVSADVAGASTSAMDADPSGAVGASTVVPLLDEGESILDRAFLHKKIEQYRKVFPNYDVLGWYSTGSGIHAADMFIHKTLMEYNESPIYVLLNPVLNPAGKDLPITIFESELHVIDGSPSMIFVSSSYTIETVEAERISVDHVAHIKPSDGSSASTQLAAHMMGMHSAVKMLSSRVRLLHALLLAMQQGEQKLDHSVVRQASSILRRLPAVASPRFFQEYLTEHNDTLLMAYMASITKGINSINELVEKFNIAYDKQGKRGTLASFV